MSHLRAAGTPERAELAARILALIAARGTERDIATARDALLLDILRWQARHVPPFAAWLHARRFDPSSHASERVEAWPGLPTEVFRHARVAAHPEALDVARFQTSGTTSGRRGVHPFRDLSLYEASAHACAERFLFPDVERMRIALLTPPPEEAPDSSLSFMTERFVEWFGRGEPTRCWRHGRLLVEALEATCERAQRRREPLAILGTAFAFLFAEEALGDTCFRLPPGSRLMPTGGTKGRTREVPWDELIERLARRYGVPPSHIVGEYGMTELSSQAYEPGLRDLHLGTSSTAPRRYVPPPWVRLDVVHPETLQPLPLGAEGLVRVFDPANLDSVAAVQTLDVGRLLEDGVQLLGRAPGAVTRGCSLSVEEALASPERPHDA